MGAARLSQAVPDAVIMTLSRPLTWARSLPVLFGRWHTDFASRGSGVQIPSAPPSSEAGPIRGLAFSWPCSTDVQQSSAVKLLPQPPKCLAGAAVGNLGVDLHRDRDLAVTQHPHGYPGVDAERGQQ